VETTEGPTKYAPTVAVSLPLVNVNAGEATAGLGAGEAVAGESPVRPEKKRTKVRNLKNELFFVMFVLELLKIGIAHHHQYSPNARQSRHGETRKWYPSGKGFCADLNCIGISAIYRYQILGSQSLASLDEGLRF
jgi:hypothetical protein